MISRDILRELSPEPGVYILKDANGDVLYVGAAENVKDSVTAHSKAQGKPREKAIALAYLTSGVDVIGNAEERESIAARAIEQYKPRFNDGSFTGDGGGQLILTVANSNRGIIQKLAELRYTENKGRGTMTSPSVAEYVRYLITRDMQKAVLEIDRRRK